MSIAEPGRRHPDLGRRFLAKAHYARRRHCQGGTAGRALMPRRRRRQFDYPHRIMLQSRQFDSNIAMQHGELMKAIFNEMIQADGLVREPYARVQHWISTLGKADVERASRKPRQSSAARASPLPSMAMRSLRTPDPLRHRAADFRRRRMAQAFGRHRAAGARPQRLPA